MIKEIFISDLHYGKGDDLLLQYMLSYLVELEAFVIKNGIQRIVIAGDVSDKRKIVDVRIVSLIRTVWERISNRCEVIAIRGNHDSYYTTTGDVHSLEIFLGKNIKVVADEPLFVPASEHTRYNRLYVPWLDDSNRDKNCKIIEQHNNSETIMVGHFEFAGFSISPGYISKESQLEKYMYNKYALIISGHYHDKQSEGNILYLGSPYQMTFGEVGLHGFHISSGELCPMFIQNINSLFIKSVIPDNLDDSEIAKICSEFKSRIVDVFIDSNDGAYILKVEDFISKSMAHRINIRVKDEIPTIDVSDVEKMNKMSDEEVVNEYISKATFGTESEDLFIKQRMTQLYSEMNQ